MILRGNSDGSTCLLRPSSLKIWAQVRISDSSGVLWMIVPEPKPVDRLPRTRIRTTVSHGLGLVKAGSACSLSLFVGDRCRCSARTLLGDSAWSSLSSVPSPVSSRDATWAIGVGRRLCLGRGGLVEVGKLGCRLRASRAVELASGTVDHDERRNAVDMVALRGAWALWSMSIVLIGYPLRINCSTAGRTLWHGPHHSA